MRREEVLSLIATHHEELKRLGVKKLNLFGSVARNQAHSESDVDFLVEFSIEAGLFDLFRVQHYLEDLLECKVDLGTEDALREHLREPVMKDIIRVF
ncbi:MAG: nucleotidyltransferase family protein [Leptolyngbyaceae cyanobacterium SL_5_14]|nr:nucleotidyltransferase family protein [Leptolyngbyaceae cyanobacterium SL_5_14]